MLSSDQLGPGISWGKFGGIVCDDGLTATAAVLSAVEIVIQQCPGLVTDAVLLGIFWRRLVNFRVRIN